MAEQGRSLSDQLLSTDGGATTAVTPTDRQLRLLPPDVRPDGATRREPAASRYERYVKRTIDLVVGSVLLLLSLPVMALLAIVIRVHLGKGVIYRQPRVGRHGRVFTLYKFRTMHTDRRNVRAPFNGTDRRVCHKRDDDPRHTPLGRFLRQIRADEIPQLWNVVLGHMSLVGPRPELVTVVDRYQLWQHPRHEVKPGLTGLWQISGQANGLAYQGVDLDVDYVCRMSFRTDCRVLVSTVPALLRRGGR